MKPVVLLIVCAGVLAAFETLARLLRQVFFWYDVHLSFWSSAILIAPVFALPLLLQGIGMRRVAAVLLFGFSQLVVALAFLLLGLELYYRFSPDPFLALLLTVAGTVLLTVLSARLFRPYIFGDAVVVRDGSAVRPRSGACSSAALFLFILMSTALGYDLLQYGNPPEKRFESIVVARDGKPNIVLVTLDTFRFDLIEATSRTGAEITPFLNSMLPQSLYFPFAQSSSSWTLPAHASIFTGLQPDVHGATRAHQTLDAQYPTIAEILHERGYETYGVTGGPYCSQVYGLARGFQRYSDRLDFFEWRHLPYLVNLRKLVQVASPTIFYRVFGADGERTAPEIFEEMHAWLESRSSEQPFFLFLNLFDAHDPYNLGAEYLHLFSDREIDVGSVIARLDAIGYHPKERYFATQVEQNFIEDALALYHSEVRFTDVQFQRFVERIWEHDSNTLFIVTSDHGEEFFEHGGAFHDQTLYEEVIRVPLLIFGSGIEGPARYEERVETRRVFHFIQNYRLGKSVEDIMELFRSEDETTRSFLSARPGYYERAVRSVTRGGVKEIEVEDPIGRVQPGVYDLRDSVIESEESRVHR